MVLLIFKFDTFGIKAKVPMSTTWVFLGMLAGREGLRIRLKETDHDRVWPMVFSDLGKATLGLVISVALVVLLYVYKPRSPRIVWWDKQPRLLLKREAAA